jgi:hypothetical protein
MWFIQTDDLEGERVAVVILTCSVLLLLYFTDTFHIFFDWIASCHIQNSEVGETCAKM